MPEKKTDEKKTTEKAYKPALKELRMPAVAARLGTLLEGWPLLVYNAMADRGISMSGVYRTIACWFDPGETTYTEVRDALHRLAAGGLVRLESKLLQNTKGEVFDDTKAWLLPVESMEQDAHFMAALALRMP